MGKKGKRTKWQALPMEEDTTMTTTTTTLNCNGGGASNGGGAGGYKKFRPFSTYNGDNSYKTAVLGPQRGYYSARQQTNDYDNGLPGADKTTSTTTATTAVSNGGYLAEKDPNFQANEYGPSKTSSSTATSTTYPTNGHAYYNNHRYNRDYPSGGGRGFSSSHYKSRYQSANRDCHSVHSNYSATHHKNSGASSTTSSTTSSSYQNYENGWRSSRNSHYRSRPYNNLVNGGYNKENSGYASNSYTSGNEEYTRITTPRQDVLFKKGYLSRPKREEGYLGPPLISQQHVPDPSAIPVNATPVNGETPAAIPPAELDPQALSEDNSQLFFCPGFVDHNGYFHANPTFMPTTFDQYGQPIVMMPYPSPPPAATGPADQFHANDNNLAPEVENQIAAEGLIVVDESIVAVENELTEKGDLLASAAEVPELIQEEEVHVELPEDSPEITGPIEAAPESSGEEIPEPNETSMEAIEETLSNEEQAIPLTINGELVADTDCPLIDGEPAVNNNAMPLDPASNSFYPQSSMYPYYPMVFTPQQLPPNTSIIPLADLYYNENYAGLAAEIFGLTESTAAAGIQCDDASVSTPCDEEQLPAQSQEIAEDEGENVVESESAVAVENVAIDSSTDSADAPTYHPDVETTIAEQQPQPSAPVSQDDLINTALSTIAQIDNAVELAAKSNLKVDVEEFHPRIPSYPTPAQAAHATTHRQYRNQYNAPTPSIAQYYNSSDQQYPRRGRAEDDYRRRRYTDNTQNGSFNRAPRKTFNNPPDSKLKQVVEKKPELPSQSEKHVSPAPPPPAPSQKTNKSANKPNSKRAILESIKQIEEQNIDLSKTRITAAQSSASTSDSNQWLVKTKGKKTKAAQAFDIPAEDMFENEVEIVSETPVQVPVLPTPEPVIRASTPVKEIDEVIQKTNEIAIAETKGPKTPANKPKKSPIGKTSSPTVKSKGKNGKKTKAKGTTANESKGFEVIEPDFGVITRLKTEPIALDQELQEELENILNMKEIEEELAKPVVSVDEEAQFNKSSSLPRSPRSEKDNVIDFDDLEALERSLMDFDLSGELKERMIEIIQSELEVPLGGDEEGNPIENDECEVTPIINPELQEVAKEEEEAKVVTNNEEVSEENISADEGDVLVVNEEVEAPAVEVKANNDKVEEAVVLNEDHDSPEDQCEQTELKLITSGINIDGNCTGSSSSSSSLSSPIPTDDGRDGSNSESDDAMTPPAIFAEEQEKKMVLPSQLEGRLFPLEQVKEVPEATTVVQSAIPIEGTGIAASVSKWLEEKEKECSPEPLLRIPDDPEVAKLIFKAMYGVDLALDGVEDDDEFETEDDDMDSLDESDYEPDSRDPLKNLLMGGRGVNGEKRDNQVPIDTDSDYMSDGQNIKPVDMGKMPPNKSSATTTTASVVSADARGCSGTSARSCKVM